MCISFETITAKAAYLLSTTSLLVIYLPFLLSLLHLHPCQPQPVFFYSGILYAFISRTIQSPVFLWHVSVTQQSFSEICPYSFVYQNLLLSVFECIRFCDTV